MEVPDEDQEAIIVDDNDTRVYSPFGPMRNCTASMMRFVGHHEEKRPSEFEFQPTEMFKSKDVSKKVRIITKGSGASYYIDENILCKNSEVFELMLKNQAALECSDANKDMKTIELECDDDVFGFILEMMACPCSLSETDDSVLERLLNSDFFKKVMLCAHKYEIVVVFQMFELLVCSSSFIMELRDVVFLQDFPMQKCITKSAKALISELRGTRAYRVSDKQPVTVKDLNKETLEILLSHMICPTIKPSRMYEE